MKMEYPVKFKAAILERNNEPLVIDEVEFRGPLLAGQVLVEVCYSGICGKQIEEIKGSAGPDRFLPHLLGHEASGHVLDIGPGVRKVQPKDPVVLHWLKGSGMDAATPLYHRRGERVNAGWVTTFNELAVVSENRVTKVPPGTDMLAACLLGCAVTTGIGVIVNEARVKPGDAVAIFGCGGVGLNAVQGAALVQAQPIIAVDKNAAALALAKQFGASHLVDSAKQDPVAAVKELTGGLGAKFVIIATADVGATEQAIEAGSAPGEVYFVGVPPRSASMKVSPFAIHCRRSLLGSYGGGTCPDTDIVRYLELHRRGQIKLKELVSQVVTLDRINDGIALLSSGKPGRCVVDLGRKTARSK
jgi:S-(hydroxymethyl)glutathione dehydrogenase/alcohol dehydrogenase